MESILGNKIKDQTAAGSNPSLVPEETSLSKAKSNHASSSQKYQADH